MSWQVLLRRTALVAALGLIVSGCGGDKGTVPVEGVVLLDGTALEGATVLFDPEVSGQPAVAVTAADGSFKLGTQSGAGAMPNTYRVTVTKVTDTPVLERPPWIGRRGQPPTKEEVAAWKQRTAEAKKQERSLVPEVYTKLNTTPLRFTVPIQGKLRVELSSAPPTGAEKTGS